MTKTLTLADRLLEAQRNIGAAKKGADNPFFKSKYADLPAVMEVVKQPLNDAGISVTQEMKVHRNSVTGEPYNVLHTVLRSGDELIESSVLVPAMTDIQKFGGAISYLKRYALQALLFVPTEDLDGEDVMERKPKRKTSARPKAAAKTADIAVSF